MELGKKYYGILMDRQSIDPSIYVLKPKYVISGILSKEDGEVHLVDDMNGYYYLADDVATIFYEVQTSVAFLISEEDLKNSYPDCSIDEAKAQYFDNACRFVHCYSEDSISDNHIDIISFDLADLIYRMHTGEAQIINDDADENEKRQLSNILKNNSGEEIVALTLEELKSIIQLEKPDEIKNKLQKIYDDVINLKEHFLQSEQKEQSIDEMSKRLSGENIIALFNAVCDEVETISSVEELKKLFKEVEEIFVNIIMILEKRGGTNADDCLAANDFLYRLIDCFDDIADLQDMHVIRHEMRELREKEIVNINQTAKIFDKYAEQFKNQNKNNVATSLVAKEEKPKTLLKAREMKQYLDKIVIGQEEAKKDIISAIIMNSLSDNPNDRTACLLIGPTGSGKTLIISTISQYLDKPVEIIDSTQLTVPGYVGANIEDFLSNLIDKAGGDIKKAEEGIVAFDEIDKKGTEKNSDVSGRGVLNTLLSFIQGTTYQVKYNGRTVQFDTSKLTVFATGAFTSVAKQLTNETGLYKTNTIGFGATQQKEKNVEDVKYPTLTMTDLVKYGHMPAELLGRISTITQLTGHTKESLKQILVSSESSTLLAEQRKLAKIGIELKWTSGYIDAITERALKLKTGGRSLKSAVEKSIKDARWIALENLGEYSCIVLGAKTVEDSFDCTLIDVNGVSHNLKEFIQKEEEKAKVKQKTALN